MLKIHIKYIKYICRHKWYVLAECHKRGITWRGITHDLGKFRWSEWKANADFLVTGEKGPEYDLAQLHHQHRNKDHWQYWVYRGDDFDRPLPIPTPYRTEMLCDWIAAGKMQGREDVLTWYIQHAHRIVLAPETREWVMRELGFGQEKVRRYDVVRQCEKV